MNAFIYEGPETVAVRDIPVPELKDGQARIRVSFCGVCGSDIGIYSGTHPRAKPPLVMGHEFIGVIEELKGESNGFKVGDRVAPYPLISCGDCFACRTGIPHVCNTLKLIGIDLDGGMAEYVNCSTDVLFHIDESVPDKAAATIEPLAVAVHTLHRSGFKPLDKIAIMGAGPIGVLVGIMAKHSGAAKIIISDFDPARLEMCKKLGFEAVNTKGTSLTDYVMNATNGDGADIVFECTGSASAAEEMTKPCRIDGTICLVGVHKAPRPIALADMHFRELHLVATRVYTKRDFAQAVEFTKEISSELEEIVTHTLPLANCENTFDLIKDPSQNAVKVLIDCR